jgi:hypothetical protein
MVRIKSNGVLATVTDIVEIDYGEELSPGDNRTRIMYVLYFEGLDTFGGNVVTAMEIQHLPKEERQRLGLDY